jgi:hypothetical protein
MWLSKLAEIVQIIGHSAAASEYHWLFSSLVGLGVFLLTQIISYAVCATFPKYALRVRGLSFYILGLGFACAFAAAWFVHVQLDLFSGWWTAPIDAPLRIILH